MKRPLKVEDISLSLSPSSLEILDLIYSSIVNDSTNIEPAIFNRIFTVVELREVKGFYAIFYKYISRIKELNAITNSEHLKISDKSFEDFFNLNLTSFLTSEEIQINTILSDMEFNDAVKLQDDMIIRRHVYDYVMKKYSLIKSMNETLTNLMLNLDNLLSSVKKDYLEFNIYQSASILSEGLNLKGLTLIGSEDCHEFNKFIINIVDRKIQDYNLLNSNVTDLSNMDSYRELAKNSNMIMKPICQYGFPPIDNISGMTNQDIITLVASEGTGKTNYCAATAAREIVNGFSVIFMAGETVKLKAIHMVLSHLIYLRTSTPDKPGLRISWQEITNDYDKLPEVYKAEIDRARYDLFENPKFGYLMVVNKFNYLTFQETVLSITRSHPDYKWGHVIVDHIDALDEKANFKEYGLIKDHKGMVSKLYQQAIDLKNDFGIPTLFTAHTSYETEKALLSSKKTGVRVGATSSSTSKDVDVVILFESNEELAQHKLLKVTLKKFRNYDITTFQPFVVLKEFEACLFTYSTSLQGVLNGDKEKMLDIKNVKSEELLD